ncbi:hypothetical protein ACFB49_25450 [Sphingomonas sp. DBB INV C78]|uniref:RNA polymerase sigma factor n=1 Tax=Sphingomonas sp. DBB INV C78 TaxID=3349434 RepID=UPI0036D43E49
MSEDKKQDRVDAAILRLLKRAFLALPKEQQQVFGLNRFAGLDYEQIALLTGSDPATVERHVADALLALARATPRLE